MTNITLHHPAPHIPHPNTLDPSWRKIAASLGMPATTPQAYIAAVEAEGKRLRAWMAEHGDEFIFVPKIKS